MPRSLPLSPTSHSTVTATQGTIKLWTFCMQTSVSVHIAHFVSLSEVDILRLVATVHREELTYICSLLMQ